MQAKQVHMRAWQRRQQTISCVLSARTRTASPLVLRVPVSAGQLLVSIDGAPQTRRPGNGGTPAARSNRHLPRVACQ
jgi:hypothetical protein